MKDENKKILAALAAQAKMLEKQAETLEAHTKRFDSIDEKLEEQGKTLEKHSKTLEKQAKTLEEHSKILENQSETLEEHSKILENQSETLENHTEISMGHTKRLNNVEGMIDKFKNVPETLDRLVALIEKSDHELTATTHRTIDLDERVEVLEEDVNKKIKPALSLT